MLLDMQLPDIDGLEVLQALRADPATAALRCVVLSANAMPGRHREARWRPASSTTGPSRSTSRDSWPTSAAASAARSDPSGPKPATLAPQRSPAPEPGMNFTDQIAAAEARHQSMLCVGLDPEPARFPGAWKGDASRIHDFCAAIVEATKDLVLAFKPQIAYFAAHRAEDQLERLMATSAASRRRCR
jgi:CheY-like chemotaxis protein